MSRVLVFLIFLNFASYDLQIVQSLDIVPSWPPPVTFEPILSEKDPAAQFLSEGMRFSLLDDMDNAIRALRAASKMNPASPEPLIQLAVALCTIQQDAMAALEAKRAVSTAQRHAAQDEALYWETLRDRLQDGRCCRLPMLFPSATVVQEDLDAYTEHCR